MEKHSPKWKITITPVMRHISGTVKHMMMIFGTVVLNDDISMHFFEIFIFRVVREVKEQKIAQNEKYQLHPSCAISQGQYSLWSWFLVHLCKMMISPGVFFIFFFLDSFIFRAVLGVKGQKMAQDNKKILSVCTSYLRRNVSYDCYLW